MQSSEKKKPHQEKSKKGATGRPGLKVLAKVGLVPAPDKGHRLVDCPGSQYAHRQLHCGVNVSAPVVDQRSAYDGTHEPARCDRRQLSQPIPRLAPQSL